MAFIQPSDEVLSEPFLQTISAGEIAVSQNSQLCKYDLQALVTSECYCIREHAVQSISAYVCVSTNSLLADGDTSMSRT